MNLLKIFHEKSQPNLVKANIILLILVALMLVGVAFFPADIQDTLNKILITAIFFSSIFALATRSGLLFPLAITLTLLQWIGKILDNDLISVIAGLANMIFFIYVVLKLIRQFSGAKTVSSLVILGSVNGYLMMGYAFTLITMIISGIYPDSFFSAHLNGYLTIRSSMHTFLYYTFITMATVGYGDITPVTSAARAISVLVAICGQLYIAVVIAFLVGKFASGQVSKRTGGQAD